MIFLISNCGSDENKKYRGGRAGDQTGDEWRVISWYNRPWSCVLRWPGKRVAQDIAYCARAAAENDKIGYDQDQRDTFWKALCNVANYDPALITVACEADCSCGVASIVKAVGYRQGISALSDIDPDYYWTGNLRAGLKDIGFQVLTGSKYVTSDRYLLPGDILLYDNHHTAINLDVGSMVRDEWDPVPTYVPGWHRDDKGWWYAKDEHHFAKKEWMKINKCWYFFDFDGYAVTGHQVIDGKQWYFNAEAGHPKECALMVTDPEGALKVWVV